MFDQRVLDTVSFNATEGRLVADRGLRAATPATVTWAGLGLAAFVGGVNLGQAVD